MNANGRRYRQAKNRFNHLTPRQRPNYKLRDLATSQRHEAKVRATANRIKQGKR